MCGLFGAIVNNTAEARASLQSKCIAAQSAQQHRGPDMSQHRFYDAGDRLVLLAHQRLSILDLSENGQQPMRSHNGQADIVYNGEIYNYQELARTYDVGALHSGSDTEVVLECLTQLPTEQALRAFNGMWAMALYRPVQRTLMLTRDRAGIKPLYYTIIDGDIYFASEIKTLLLLTGKRFRLNLSVVGRYIEQSLQDDTNDTFFEGIQSLTPGSFIEIDVTATVAHVSPVSYWDPFAATPFYENPQETFHALVMDAVKLRLRADVPVGVTLSGGLDSSLICHAMHHHLGHSDFTVLSAVAPGEKGDESYYIDRMAQAYGLNVTKLKLGWDASETESLMHTATWQNDAPLGSFSNLAFYLLMKAATDHGVKVILSGQGADELLCGYKKYLGFYVKHLVRARRYGKAAMTIAEFLANGTVINQFSLKEAKRYMNGGTTHVSILSPSVQAAYVPAALGAIGTTLAQRQWMDYRHFSVPYLTHYEDRMSMAFSREVRLPYLDYRLVEFLLNAPDAMKLHQGWTKWIMRDSFRAELPDEIIWRKDKQGFTSPQEEWLKGSLKPLLQEYFGADALIYRYGLVDRERLQSRYEDYCRANSNVWYREIFNPFALEVWLRQFESYLEPVN